MSDRVSNRRFKITAAAILALALAATGFYAVLRAEDAPPGEPSPGRPLRKGVVIFVLDASASMRIRDVPAGETRVPRIHAAVREIGDTLDGLEGNGDFYFDIVLCSSRIEVLSEFLGREGPLPLDGAMKDSALKFLSGRKGAGMTRMVEALLQALWIAGRAKPKWGPGTVFLYTDGIPTFRRQAEGPRSNEEFLAAVRAANTGLVRINAFALSATSEGVSFLRRLCAENHGILFTP